MSEMFKQVNLLDHGFVRLVDKMGDDAAIVQAARVSYGTGTKTVNEDKGLINYLVRNKHTSPLEMVEFKFHIKMPIFVARQWIRHRTASVNEYSARYSIMDKEFYIPSAENLAAQSTKNHQGRGEEPLSKDETDKVLRLLKAECNSSYESYLMLMNEDENGEKISENRQGIARELARMVLPVNIYTQWYWKIDLHNLLHFLRLRTDSHAQYEIRVFAEAIANVVKEICPLAYEAFEIHVKNAITFSQNELEELRQIINADATIVTKLKGTQKTEFEAKLQKIKGGE